MRLCQKRNRSRTVSGLINSISASQTDVFIHLSVQPKLLPPCLDIMVAMRALRQSTGEIEYYVAGEKIDQPQFSQLIEAAATSESVPIVAQGPDWGYLIGIFRKVYRNRHGEEEPTQRPVWLNTLGDDCARIAIETVTFSEPMWGDRGYIGSGRTAWFTLKEAMTDHPNLLPPCDKIKLLNRAVRETTGKTDYFVDGDEIPQDRFDALVATFGEDDRPGGYAGLPQLPAHVDPSWQQFANGTSNGERAEWVDRLIASYAYHGLTDAYSRWVDQNPRCFYPGDGTAQLTMTYDGARDRNSTTLYFPPSHTQRIRQAFEGRPNPDVRYWRRQAWDIVQADGCRGPLTLVMRENLKRFLEHQPALSAEQAAALLATRK